MAGEPARELYEYVVRVLTSSIRQGPRYRFIDEITTCRGEWWTVIENLRDHTGLRDDCVVLTGSSNGNLGQAMKAFAGRRGPVPDPDRALLPMSFGSFCRSVGASVPSVTALRADELMSRRARDVWLGLAPHTDDLSAAWQAYLEVGGYPSAVADWRRSNTVEIHTWRALWDVARGDAITSGIGESVLGAILQGVADRLTSLVSLDGLAGEVGMGRDALQARLGALIAGFLVWPCPRANATGHVDRRKQRKLYFLDPLVARLPEFVYGRPHIEITKLNEQQVGVALLQWCETVRRGSVRSDEWIAHDRGSSGEIDFAGRCPDTLSRMTPIDGKYVSDSWRRQALGIRNSPLGRGILATRDVLDVTQDSPVWAVPASFIAYALSES